MTSDKVDTQAEILKLDFTPVSKGKKEWGPWPACLGKIESTKWYGFSYIQA